MSDQRKKWADLRDRHLQTHDAREAYERAGRELEIELASGGDNRGGTAVIEGAIVHGSTETGDLHITATRIRSTVSCEEACGAFEEPETLDEYKSAHEHWKNHESSWGGCSHGR